MRTASLWALLALTAVLLTGCLTTGGHAVYVPDGTPVRLRDVVKDVPVWVLDPAGKPIASVVDLPAGWFVLPWEGGVRGNSR